MGYTGLLCEHEVKCGNCIPGKCAHENLCLQCHKGWRGSVCTEMTCDGIDMCAHGKSLVILGKCKVEDDARICECDSGWEGEFCTNLSCDNQCNYDGNI